MSYSWMFCRITKVPPEKLIPGTFTKDWGYYNVDVKDAAPYEKDWGDILPMRYYDLEDASMSKWGVKYDRVHYNAYDEKLVFFDGGRVLGTIEDDELDALNCTHETKQIVYQRELLTEIPPYVIDPDIPDKFACTKDFIDGLILDVRNYIDNDNLDENFKLNYYDPYVRGEWGVALYALSHLRDEVDSGSHVSIERG